MRYALRIAMLTDDVSWIRGNAYTGIPDLLAGTKGWVEE